MGERWGRDRLTLFAEICDALDIVPVLIPRGQAAQILRSIESADVNIASHQPARPAFDELFVDLGRDEKDDH